MILSQSAAEQRDKEAKIVKRFLAFSFPGVIVFNLLLATVISLAWHGTGNGSGQQGNQPKP